MKIGMSRGEPASQLTIPLPAFPPDPRPESAANESYRASFHLAPIGLVHVAADGTYLAANQRFCEMVGYTHEELLRLRFADLTHPDDLPGDHEAVRRMISREVVTNTGEKRYVHKDGGIVWAHVTSTLVFDEIAGEPLYFITAIEDVGPRIEAERALRQSKEDLQFAVSAAQLGTFYCDWPLDKIIWNDTCKEHFFLPHDAEIDFDVFYSRLHPDDREPTRAAIERAANERVEYNVQYRIVGPEGQIRWVNAVGRFFYADDGTPVRFDGITIDITERKEAELQRMAQARREALLNRIAQSIRTSFDPDAIQEVATRALGEFLNADRCYFNIIDKPGDSWSIDSDYRRPDLPSLSGQYKISEIGFDPGAYLSVGKTLVIEDTLDGSLPEILSQSLRQTGLRSVLAVPLFEEEQLVAVLTVAMAGERQWSAEDVAVSEAVATYTRAALEAARLISERQDRLERDALINRIEATLRSTSDPAEIQATALKLLGEALRADRCYLGIYDLAQSHLAITAEWRRSDNLSPVLGVHAFPNTREMFAEIYKDTHASVVEDTYASGLSAQTIANLESLQLRSRISVALLEGHELAATLVAAMADSPRQWTSDEAALVETVATQVRTAVEMAQLQQREHRIATELQAALQPSVPDRVPSLDVAAVTKPALDDAAIGGDFFDVFPLENGRYAIVVGDVSGKGLAAAAQLATVRNMLRAFLYQSRSPADAATRLNHTLTTHGLLSGFVTVVVCVYHAQSGEFAYASCGHEPALVLRAASRQVDALHTGGPPLGTVETAAYVEHRERLHDGDTLLLYTDGMSEAGPTRRELLGTEGLVKHLAQAPHDSDAESVAHWLVRQASDFANGVFHDDVCVVVARREAGVQTV